METNLERQRAAYNRNFRQYEAAIAPYHRLLERYTIRRWADPFAHRDVLDIGCGTGYVLTAMRTLRIPYRSYIGVDIAEVMIEFDAAETKGLPNVRFLVDNAETLEEIPDASVDVAVSYGCCHHLQHPERSIQAAHRVLRPGGRRLGFENNRRHPAACFIGFYAYLLGIRGDRWISRLPPAALAHCGETPAHDSNPYILEHPGHPGKRTPREYRNMLADAGFVNARVSCLYLDLLLGLLFTRHPALFSMMVRLSRPLMRFPSIRDVGPELLIEATKPSLWRTR